MMLTRGFRCFSTAASKRVGFIGLGNMGMPMAKNLVGAGFEVKGFDLNEKTRAQCADNGVTAVNSLKEVSQDVDFIVTSLPKTEHVESVLMADDGVFASANEGTTICDVSTISPLASQEFAVAAKKHNVVFVDSPMSGGIMGAHAGTLTFMVGTDSEDEFNRAKVVLEGMGKKIFHCGGPGTGEIAKISNNMILGIQMIAVSEGLALGEKLGIDPKKLSEILSVSTSSCWCTNATNPRPGVVEGSPASRNYEGGFQTGLIRKDMTLALELAEKVDANVEFANESMQYYLDLEKKGHSGKDFGYVFQYIMKNKKI